MNTILSNLLIIAMLTTLGFGIFSIGLLKSTVLWQRLTCAISIPLVLSVAAFPILGTSCSTSNHTAANTNAVEGASSKTAVNVGVSGSSQSPVLVAPSASNVVQNNDYSSKVSIDTNVIKNTSTISVSGENNGNIANVQNSPSATVNQSVVNQYPRPHIYEKYLISLNTPAPTDNGHTNYETTFRFEVGNYPPPGKLILHCDYSPQVINQPAPRFHGGGEDNRPEGLIQFEYFEITFLTAEKVKESDFGPFSADASP